MAEFNTPSSARLLDLLGHASEKSLAAIPSFIASQSLYSQLKTGFTIQNPLNVKEWKYELSHLILGLRVYFNCKIEAIDFDDLEVQNKHLGQLIDIQYLILEFGAYRL
jgi:hypothetical protein